VGLALEKAFYLARHEQDYMLYVRDAYPPISGITMWRKPNEY